jgi:microcystin-dependent protein
MADPFIGEIRAFAFTYAPYGWATCDGQTMHIQQNTALFAVIGNRFGGNGSTNFCLPNLSGRSPMNFGAGPGLTNRELGAAVGDATVSLAANNFPPHSHGLNVVSNTNADSTAVANHYLSKPPTSGGKPPKATDTYLSPPVTAQLAADAVQLAGTASVPVPHGNMQPYLPVLLCIAINGIFPARG